MPTHNRLFSSAVLLFTSFVAIGFGFGFTQPSFAGDPAETGQTWNSYQQALAKSKATGRPVMLVFSGSDWCSWCVRLEREVFSTRSFQNWATQSAIAVKVDFPRSTQLPAHQAQVNQHLKNKFGQWVSSYPTVLFVDANEQVIGKTGYVAGGAQNWISQADQFYRPADAVVVK